MSNPLHLAVANVIRHQLNKRTELVQDSACGGHQRIPLFIGKRKARDTRMCCVDLLIIQSDQVRVIVEIEESGFLPTKICGKFLQAALADHFIHNSRRKPVVPYAPKVLFVQILDGSKCLIPGTRKDVQAELIEQHISNLLPLRGITEYKLFFVCGTKDKNGLISVGEAVSSAIT